MPSCFFFRSNEEFIGCEVEDLEGEERDGLADLPDRVDGGGVGGLLNPKLTTIDIRQVKLWCLKLILQSCYIYHFYHSVDAG